MDVKRLLPVILTLVVVLCSVSVVFGANKLIVVLVDGFRWDYIDDPDIRLQGIPEIIKNGVRAPYVKPVYPSLSYPNWYTIVTGLYPESHDMVNNVMYDNQTGDSFLMLPDLGTLEEHWWSGAEPIWVTAEKQGEHAAMYWWVGCEVRIKGRQPSICEQHRYGPGTEEDKTDFLERVDDVLEMFRPERKERLSLALMYYGSVDYTGHYSGPKSSESRRAVKDIDEVLYKTLQKIEQAGLKNEVNIMIVSDHGMTDVREPGTKYIDLEKFAPSIKHQVSYGATMMLVPEDGMLDKLYNDLKDAKITGMQVYKKEEIPDSFHLKRSPMVNDIFLKADKGYLIQALTDSTKRVGDLPTKLAGHHGFHPDDVPDMRTIFFATGPAFRKGFVSKPLNNTDLYNMMCSILQIQPLPNNGSLELVKDILADGKEPGPLVSKSPTIAVNSLCLMLPLIVFMLHVLSFKCQSHI